MISERIPIATDETRLWLVDKLPLPIKAFDQISDKL